MSRFCSKCDTEIGHIEGHPDYRGLVRCPTCGLIQDDTCKDCRHAVQSKFYKRVDIILYSKCPYSTHSHYALAYCKFKESKNVIKNV